MTAPAPSPSPQANPQELPQWLPHERSPTSSRARPPSPHNSETSAAQRTSPCRAAAFGMAGWASPSRSSASADGASDIAFGRMSAGRTFRPCRVQAVRSAARGCRGSSGYPLGNAGAFVSVPCRFSTRAALAPGSMRNPFSPQTYSCVLPHGASAVRNPDWSIPLSMSALFRSRSRRLRAFCRRGHDGCCADRLAQNL